MMESIEKLRELAADINSTEIIDHLDVVGKFMFHVEWLDSWHKAFDAACDEIEREIEDRIDDLMATSVEGYPEPFNMPDAMHMILGTAADNFETPQDAVRYLQGCTSMELPLDADGVPIHVGDELCGYGRPNGGVTVSSVTGWGGVIVTDKGMTCNPAKDGLLWDGQECRHVKPRTLEDVLADLVIECDERYGEGKLRGDLFPKYAAEIRELLGVEE